MSTNEIDFLHHLAGRYFLFKSPLSMICVSDRNIYKDQIAPTILVHTVNLSLYLERSSLQEQEFMDAFNKDGVFHMDDALHFESLFNLDLLIPKSRIPSMLITYFTKD